jgi:hypothetical protein
VQTAHVVGMAAQRHPGVKLPLPFWRQAKPFQASAAPQLVRVSKVSQIFKVFRGHF